jgi:hypothetical protein
MTNNNTTNAYVLGSRVYKDKILSNILKPLMHYYGVKYEDDILNSFCESLSKYDYNILIETKNELLAEYKTFPKLPNWLLKCKEKRLNGTKQIVMDEELLEIIETNNSQNRNWIYVKNRIREEFGTNIFDCWFRDVNLIEEKEKEIILSVNNSFISDYIKRNYLNGTKTKLSSGEERWLRRGIKEYWQETNPNIETIEIKTIREIEKELKNKRPDTRNQINEDGVKKDNADKDDMEIKNTTNQNNQFIVNQNGGAND